MLLPENLRPTETPTEETAPFTARRMSWPDSRDFVGFGIIHQSQSNADTDTRFSSSPQY